MSVQGNSNAEKYPREEIINIMSRITEGLKKGKYSSIHRAYLSEGIYSALVDYWKKRFSDDATVLSAIKTVSKLGHELLRSNMLDGTVNSTAAIWIDKSVYKSSEKTEDEKERIKAETEAIKQGRTVTFINPSNG